jgi:hypothetical protein
LSIWDKVDADFPSWTKPGHDQAGMPSHAEADMDLPAIIWRSAHESDKVVLGHVLSDPLARFVVNRGGLELIGYPIPEGRAEGNGEQTDEQYYHVGDGHSA